jgi:hypothetical protein
MSGLGKPLLLAVFALAAGFTPAAAEKARAPRPAPQPGQQVLQRLSQMNPRQREQFLANLPPQRRQQILRKLDEVQKLPPGSIRKVQPWLERLRTLPLEKQQEVRLSLRELNALPLERKIQVRREMAALSSLPPEKRQARLDTDDLRSRYSPQEQEIMGHLSALLPEQE